MLIKDIEGELRWSFAWRPHQCWCGCIIWLRMAQKENHGWTATPHWWWNCPEHETPWEDGV